MITDTHILMIIDLRKDKTCNVMFLENAEATLTYQQQTTAFTSAFLLL